MSDERDWTIEVNDHGSRLYPLEFHGWPTLTDSSIAAKRYTHESACKLVERLHRELPHWAERISVVRHQVPESEVPAEGGIVRDAPDR